MTADNLIQLAAHRKGAAVADTAERNAQRYADRGVEAASLLQTLRRTTRVPEEDRPVLARNLGQMIEQFDPANILALGKKVLEGNWPKRMRYIRFPSDGAAPSSRYAASGLTFAGIIDRLSKEKERKGFVSAHAITDTVLEALKGTSFRRPSPFRMKESLGDAPYLVTAMEKVADTLARQADLDEYFEVVSKYPVYPTDYSSPNRNSGRSVEMSPKREPNRLYSWQEFVDDEELRTWIPWWAPECVIGHLYVPFTCNGLRVPKQCAEDIKKMCGGRVTEDKWREEECLWEIEVKPDLIRPGRVHHRLPIWLVVLPSTSGLVPCLYATVHHWDEFQIHESVKTKTYFQYFADITPSFVEAIGEEIENDAVYFVDDENDAELTFVCARGDAIDIIGWRVDNGGENFRSDLLAAWSVYDLPEWLQDQPVQRLLRLTVDSEEANGFALTPRVFPKDFSYRRFIGIDGSETIFRPRFPNPEATHTAPVRQNTIR